MFILFLLLNIVLLKNSLDYDVFKNKIRTFLKIKYAKFERIRTSIINLSMRRRKMASVTPGIQCRGRSAVVVPSYCCVTN